MGHDGLATGHQSSRERPGPARRMLLVHSLRGAEILRAYWTLVQWRDGMASPTIGNHGVQAATAEVVRLPG